jgi:transcriptional regulator with AAA-type ATPase domain/transcriptional regulatory protein LevR
MTRLERIRKYVETDCEQALTEGRSPGLDAVTVAEALGLQRSDVSSDLNALWRAGVLVKEGKRPVKFMTVEAHEEVSKIRKSSRKRHESATKCTTDDLLKRCEAAFDNIIGANGSIKAQVQLAKAAVAYPPNGLHTLITGETGVGKSLLAEAMWRYGAEIGAFGGKNRKETPPFIVFSCAEYADNPQLLLAQLFGYVKGAFTGAHEDKPGLVERAQTGVLFLDEIHRLPPTGQELLFMLIDKGLFRRLGDSSDRHANLMIVGATTENPNSALLATFRRRIPVLIELPRLKDRPAGERLSLIEHFLFQEANRLGLPIHISGPALRVFMTYECTANVGDLKSDLQLCCAKSYLSYLSFANEQSDASQEASRVVKIDINDVPQKVYSTAELERPIDDPHLSRILHEGLEVCPGQKPTRANIINDYELPVNLYGFVQRRLEDYKYSALSQQDVEVKVGEDLEKYFYATVNALHGHENANMVPESIVAPAVWAATTELLSVASKRFKVNYSRRIVVALAIHLQQFVERAKAGQIIYNPHLRKIKSSFLREYELVDSMRTKLGQILSVNIPDDEAGFLAMFLTPPAANKEQSKRLGLVVAAHGQSTATSMAEVANILLTTSHVKAVDAPLNKALPDVFQDLARAISESDQGRGVLVLADMGSFVEMEEDLIKKTGVKCRVVPNVSTSLVLEAGKVVMTTDKSLDDATQEIIESYQAYSTALSQSTRNIGTRGIVITVCPSGTGTASKIRDIILGSVPIARTMDVIPVSVLDDAIYMSSDFRERLRLVVGSVNPGVKGVPFVPVSEILTPEGLKKVDLLLKGLDIRTNTKLPERGTSRDEALNLLSNQIERFVTSIDPSKVRAACNRVLEYIERHIYPEELPVDLMIRVYLHTACMFDRLSSGTALTAPAWIEKVQAGRKEECEKLAKFLQQVASEFKLEITEGELSYFLVALPSPEAVA